MFTLMPPEKRESQKVLIMLHDWMYLFEFSVSFVGY